MIHQTHTARKPPKTPPGSHAVCSERIPFVRTQGVSAAISAFLVPGELDLDIQTGTRLLYTAPNRQVSSSYIYSFRSYRVAKQTNKQTDKQTDKQTIPNWKHPPRSAMLRRWVNTIGNEWFSCINTTMTITTRTVCRSVQQTLLWWKWEKT